MELEDGVFCGLSCVFTNDLTPRAEYPKGHENYKKTLAKKGASIGANATIVCGHTVGRYAMVCFVNKKSPKSEGKFPTFGRGIPHYPKVT